jgi:two-component system CheB/CheR fusion protein
MGIVLPEEQFETLLEYLRDRRGFDFTGYKRTSLARRVKRRMQEMQIESPVDYVDYLEVHPEEFIHLFNTNLINVTDFFRDPPDWEYLRKEILPLIFQGKNPSDPVRIWSAGCAAGQEAYTLAMLLAEAHRSDLVSGRIKIYATDVDEEALTQARHGDYGAEEMKSVSEDLRERYFERNDQRYVFRRDLRRAVIFGRHDLVQDAPISHIDLLVCRNTMIYFNRETQQRILNHFRFALNEGGFLFLGKSELLLSRGEAFTPVDQGRRVFTKVSGVRPEPPIRVDETSRLMAAEAARAAAFESARVGQVLVDEKGAVVAANQEARGLFDLSLDDLGRPLEDFELARYKPLLELRSLVDRSYAEGAASLVSEIEWPTADGEDRFMEVQVMPARKQDGEPMGVSITFTDMTHAKDLQDELQLAKKELETAYEELQSTNEELETTNEELQSSNEELETTNEELQSSNEELETINEELQSTNEELRTINDQLRERERELSESGAFAESVLSSLRGGTIVVDTDVRVQVWTRQAEDLWGLRADEVVGQNFLNLDFGLSVEQLGEPIRACLLGRADYQELQLDAVNRRGKAIRCRVTCAPLIGPQGDIRGALLVTEVQQDAATSSKGRKSRS